METQWAVCADTSPAPHKSAFVTELSGPKLMKHLQMSWFTKRKLVHLNDKVCMQGNVSLCYFLHSTWIPPLHPGKIDFCPTLLLRQPLERLFSFSTLPESQIGVVGVLKLNSDSDSVTNYPVVSGETTQLVCLTIYSSGKLLNLSSVFWNFTSLGVCLLFFKTEV